MRTLRSVSRGQKGFSLIELLCVIAIMAVLGAILIPVVGGVMCRARLAKCVANLSGLGAGFMLYAAENNGYFPGHGASGQGETGAGQRWYQKLAPYMQLGLEEKVVRASGQSDINVRVRVCEDVTTRAIFHCSEVEPEYYMGTNPRNSALGVYRSNLNVITRTTYGLSLAQITYPTRTVLVADTYCGTDLSDKSGVVGGPNMAANAAPYPQTSSGPCANHRPDGNPSADPLGAGLCPMLFADGHAEAVELSELRPWQDCITSGKRPPKITMVPY